MPSDTAVLIAAEAIELPAHDALHSMAPHIGDELVERRAAVLCPADPLINVLDSGPAAPDSVTSNRPVDD